jgi:hypothetical protein
MRVDHAETFDESDDPAGMAVAPVAGREGRHAMTISKAQLVSFTGTDGRTRVAQQVAPRVACVIPKVAVMSPFSRRPMDAPLSFHERLGLAAVFGALALFLAVALVRGDATWRTSGVTPPTPPANVPALSFVPRV